MTKAIRPRTRTGLRKTPTLRHGGPLLSPLEGSKIRGLRPVCRRKPNKKNQPRMATKMGMGRNPVNAQASFAWPKSFARMISDATCPAAF